MTRRRWSWLLPIIGALAATLLAASPGLAATSGTWTPTGSMEQARAFFTATLLRNGDVLVAGGYDATQPHIEFNSAEIYHPADGTWRPAAPMHDVRAAAVAVGLPAGRVMVIGGENLSGPLNTAEIYDPRTNTWTETAPMLSAHDEDFVAAVSKGTHNTHVLVAGGFDANGPTADSEVYDVSTNSWKEVGSMNQARGEFAWARLPSGHILVAGGIASEEGPVLDSAEIYDPTTLTWSFTGSMNTARYDLALVRLRSGNILAAGGGDPDDVRLKTAELYHPSSGTWTTTGSMTSGRSEIEHGTVVLNDGRVLVTGGFSAPDTPQASTDIFDPDTHTWSSAGDMSSPRAGHVAVRLPDGTVLAAGGLDFPPGATETADIYSE